MDRDVRVFFKYLWKSSSPKDLFRKPRFWSTAIGILALYIFFFSSLNFIAKQVIFGISLGLIAFIEAYKLYQSGEHRHWERTELNIPSKSDIKRMKNNYKSTTQEPKIFNPDQAQEPSPDLDKLEEKEYKEVISGSTEILEKNDK